LRLYRLLKREDVLDEITYIKASVKARFIDPKYGGYWAIPSQILHGQQTGHKARQVERAKTTKIKNNSFFKPPPKKKIPVDIIEKRIQLINPKVTIVKKLYTNVGDKCWFVEEGYGKFQTTADKLMRGHCKGFPRKLERIKETKDQNKENNPNYQTEIVEKTKKTLKDRYGEKGLHSDVIQNKVKKTMIERYGKPHPMQVPEFALKCAKSTNNCYVLNHWQTDEELFCVASYEAIVVLYLNKNKIPFDFQKTTFTLSSTTYRPDFYLPHIDCWIEVKGWFRAGAKEKWDEFQKIQPNSELWNLEKLYKMGLLNKQGRPVNKKELSQYLCNFK
jgi:hypothetical protein